MESIILYLAQFNFIFTLTRGRWVGSCHIFRPVRLELGLTGVGGRWGMGAAGRTRSSPASSPASGSQRSSAKVLLYKRFIYFVEEEEERCGARTHAPVPGAHTRVHTCVHT